MFNHTLFITACVLTFILGFCHGLGILRWLGACLEEAVDTITNCVNSAVRRLFNWLHGGGNVKTSREFTPNDWMLPDREFTPNDWMLPDPPPHRPIGDAFADLRRYTSMTRYQREALAAAKTADPAVLWFPHYSPWPYRHANRMQAEDRCHRINTKKTNVHYFNVTKPLPWLNEKEWTDKFMNHTGRAARVLSTNYAEQEARALACTQKANPTLNITGMAFGDETTIDSTVFLNSVDKTIIQKVVEKHVKAATEKLLSDVLKLSPVAKTTLKCDHLADWSRYANYGFSPAGLAGFGCGTNLTAPDIVIPELKYDKFTVEGNITAWFDGSGRVTLDFECMDKEKDMIPKPGLKEIRDKVNCTSSYCRYCKKIYTHTCLACPYVEWRKDVLSYEELEDAFGGETAVKVWERLCHVYDLKPAVVTTLHLDAKKVDLESKCSYPMCGVCQIPMDDPAEACDECLRVDKSEFEVADLHPSNGYGRAVSATAHSVASVTPVCCQMFGNCTVRFPAVSVPFGPGVKMTGLTPANCKMADDCPAQGEDCDRCPGFVGREDFCVLCGCANGEYDGLCEKCHNSENTPAALCPGCEAEHTDPNRGGMCDSCLEKRRSGMGAEEIMEANDKQDEACGFTPAGCTMPMDDMSAVKEQHEFLYGKGSLADNELYAMLPFEPIPGATLTYKRFTRPTIDKRLAERVNNLRLSDLRQKMWDMLWVQEVHRNMSAMIKREKTKAHHAVGERIAAGRKKRKLKQMTMIEYAEWQAEHDPAVMAVLKAFKDAVPWRPMTIEEMDAWIAEQHRLSGSLWPADLEEFVLHDNGGMSL